MISSLGLAIALAAAVDFTIFALLSRVLLKESEEPLAFAVLYGLLTAAISFVFVFLEPWKFGAFTAGIIIVTIIAVVLYVLFEASEFLARKHLEASRLTILFQLTPVATLAASLAFLHESFSLQKLIAVVLIMCGNLVAVYKHGGKLSREGLLYGLGAAFSLGFAYVADKAVFQQYPLPLYMALTYGVPALFILPFLGRGKLLKLSREWNRVSWRLIVLGFVSVLGYYLILKTFQLAESSVAIPIVFSSTILTALGGIIILKERSSIPQKILGAVFVFLGIVLIR